MDKSVHKLRHTGTSAHWMRFSHSTTALNAILVVCDTKQWAVSTQSIQLFLLFGMLKLFRVTSNIEWKSHVLSAMHRIDIEQSGVRLFIWNLLYHSFRLYPYCHCLFPYWSYCAFHILGIHLALQVNGCVNHIHRLNDRPLHLTYTQTHTTANSQMHAIPLPFANIQLNTQNIHV